MEEVEAKVVYQWVWDENSNSYLRKPIYYEPPFAFTADEFGQLLEKQSNSSEED